MNAYELALKNSEQQNKAPLKVAFAVLLISALYCGIGYGVGQQRAGEVSKRLSTAHGLLSEPIKYYDTDRNGQLERSEIENFLRDYDLHEKETSF